MSTNYFAGMVKNYLKAAGSSQKILANELGMNSSVLTHKLNGTGRFVLTYPEIREIVRTLARLEVITYKKQVLNLLEAANCPNFSSEEWKTAPLKNLEGDIPINLHTDKGSNNSTHQKIPAYQTNLPVQLTSFIGREREIKQAKHLLSKTHFLTLTGAGGVGKTRLALQVGTELLENYKDGVWIVELAPISDPSLVAQVLVQAMELRGEPGRSLNQTLIDYFKTTQTLLIIDNCEHLMDPCASLIIDLLRNCPGLRILATSRETFEITGEVAYRVPSLSLPKFDSDTPLRVADTHLDLVHLKEFEAFQLFTERAVAVQPDFIANIDNAATIAQICLRLDGIPLAIELAAARVSYLSLEQILQNLGDRFRLLKGGNRAGLPRQQTLRALIDWSYSLLSQQEQIVLRRQAVFAGEWSIEAAIKICSGEGIEEEDVLDYLIQLVKKSLIIVGEVPHKEVRYRMLETIRQYGLEKLKLAGEDYQIHLNHLTYFLDLAEQSDKQIKGYEHQKGMNNLDGEQDNLRTALAWALAQGLEEPALRLTGALKQFWSEKGYWLEGRNWAERSLELNSNPALFPAARAKALYCAGWLAAMLANIEPARVLSQQSLELYESLGDLQGSAYARATLGMLLYFKGDYTDALVLVKRSVTDLKKINDKWGYAVTLSILGYITEAMRKTEEAKKYYEEGLILSRELRNKNEIAWFNYLLGICAENQNELTSATDHLEESVRLYRELEAKWGLSVSLDHLGVVEMLLGHFESSKILQDESVALSRKIGDRSGLGVVLKRYSVLMLLLENFPDAARYFKESLILCHEFYQEISKHSDLTTCLEGLAFLNWRESNIEKATLLLNTAERVRQEVNLPPIPIETLMQERFISIVKIDFESRKPGKSDFYYDGEQDLPLDLAQVIAIALQDE